MRRLLLIGAICLFLQPYLYGQQDAQFSQYMFNGLYLNPAYAGLEGVARGTLIHRRQWLGYKTSDGDRSAPISQVISGETKLPDNLGGAGFYMLYDKLGPIQNINFQLSYSYHVKLGKGKLGIGVRGGIYSQKVNPGFYQVTDPVDPIYQYFQRNGNVSQLKGDFTGGLWYRTHKYYGGVSFSHISRSRFNMGYDSISSRLSNHIYITGGYNLAVGSSLVLTPSLLVQSDLYEWTWLYGALATYNSKIWVGLNVRQSLASRDGEASGKSLSNDDVILYAGVNLLKNSQGVDVLRLGYAFDFVTSGINAKKRTSHEVLVSYTIPVSDTERPIIHTPRFRHEQN